VRLPFGFEIRRRAAAPSSFTTLTGGGWFPLTPGVREPYPGGWQRNEAATADQLLAFHAIYACVTLIAGDIAKMRVRLMRQDETTTVWSETESAAFSPVLRKPNTYQNRLKFFEWWITSKLLWGNAYALKGRDARGVVTTLHLLHPFLVMPLVAPDGAVFYQVKPQALAKIADPIVIPAREVIHDLMYALHHPLLGVSPIYACATAARQGLNIQTTSTNFFGNGANPGGVLTAPGQIGQESADRIKAYWETEFTGQNAGKVAVLGDGLHYEAMTVSATDAQLIEQLKWTAEVVCTAFHVPPYMIGIGPPPTYTNIQALNQQYYSQCLQELVESLELALDEGLELPRLYGTACDLDELLRMDAIAAVQAARDGVGAGFLSPNEARLKFSLPPVEGGESPYLQQQNYSLAALARRDQAPPPSALTPAGAGPPAAAELPRGLTPDDWVAMVRQYGLS
jgi:HK97 family phage portal protein